MSLFILPFWLFKLFAHIIVLTSVPLITIINMQWQQNISTNKSKVKLGIGALRVGTDHEPEQIQA